MKYVLVALFFLAGCADPDRSAELNHQLISDLQDSLYDCQDQRFNARMEVHRLESKLSKYEQEEVHSKMEKHKAKYKASNKNLQLSDLKSGNRFIVEDSMEERIFLELPDNRYSFILDDKVKISESTLMGIVNSKQEALDYAKENGYRRVK